MALTSFEATILQDIEYNVLQAMGHEAKMMDAAERAAIATCIVSYTNVAWASVMEERVWRDTYFLDAVAGLITWMSLEGDE